MERSVFRGVLTGLQHSLCYVRCLISLTTIGVQKRAHQGKRLSLGCIIKTDSYRFQSLRYYHRYGEVGTEDRVVR